MVCVNKALCRQLFTGVSVSLGGFLFGEVNVWMTPILSSLLGPDSEIPMTSEQASWIVSIPDLPSLIASIPVAMMADRIGRKPVILMSAPLFALGWAMILVFRTYVSLLVGRCIQGFATAIALSVIPVYIGEIASTEYRGTISSLFLIIFWLGHLFEYSTGPFMSLSKYTLLSLAPSVLFFALFLFQPETPYFYLMKNKRDSARRSLEWLRCSSEESVNEELKRMIITVEEDLLKKASWREVVATPTDRKALYILLFVGALKILCGSASVTAYATEIFQETTDIAIPPDVITIILGAVFVAGASVSFFLIDVVGRRPLLITSCVTSSVCMCAVSVFFYLQQDTAVDVSSYSLVPPVLVFAILVFAGVSVSGIFPISTAYASELFNSKTRSLASSLNCICVLSCAFFLRLSYNYFTDTFGMYFNFMLFTLVCALGGVVSYVCLPETKNKTFEQIRKELSC